MNLSNTIKISYSNIPFEVVYTKDTIQLKHEQQSIDLREDQDLHFLYQKLARVAKHHGLMEIPYDQCNETSNISETFLY